MKAHLMLAIGLASEGKEAIFVATPSPGTPAVEVSVGEAKAPEPELLAPRRV